MQRLRRGWDGAKVEKDWARLAAASSEWLRRGDRGAGLDKIGSGIFGEAGTGRRLGKTGRDPLSAGNSAPLAGLSGGDA